ncbi:MAG: hypothetical protein GF331_01320 [Chitinivibrionales bacterium]|nr:hypothetical protein [Chitinivibrionales bacterium]
MLCNDYLYRAPPLVPGTDSMPLYKDATAAIDDRVSDLLAQMTFEEKVEQLGGWFFPHGRPPGRIDDGRVVLNGDIQERMKLGLGTISVPNNALSPHDGALWCNALQRYLVENTRLGIPALICEECAWGHVAPEATAFPAPPSLAASWNPELTRRVFDAVALEAVSRGGSLAHTPIGDLARDPRWGRVRETFGEDACLASAMVAAAVTGLQGGPAGARPGYMAATIKHFAAFGESRGGRQMANVDVGKHVLLNELLPPYKAAVDAGVEAVMPSYNAIDGVPSHGNTWLLTHVLREAWGFAGVVTADYGAVDKMVAMGTAHDSVESSRIALEAGLDMDLPHGDNYRALFAQQRSPRLEQRLERSVARVLTLKFKLGLFDAPYRDPSEAVRIVNCEDHRKLAIEAALQSAVLIKNDGNTLPLDSDRAQRIALIGPHAALKQLGDDRRGRVTCIEGIRKWAGPKVTIEHEPGCRLTTKDGINRMYLEETAETSLTALQDMDRDPAVAALYADALPQTLPYESEKELIRRAAALAARSDVAVLCLGESSHLIGENYAPNLRCDRDDISLVGNQLALLDAVHATGTPVVVILLSGRANALGGVVEKCAAILYMIEPGEAQGTAVGRILFGHAEPVGRLPWTIPLTTGSLPVHYSMHGFDYLRHYAFRDRNHAFAFGHGLSYTTFALGEPAAECEEISAGEPVAVHADLANTGARPGTAVVQVYLRDEVSRVMRPAQWLAAWSREALAPGETRTVRVEVPASAMAFIDADERSTIEPGWYGIGVGLSSDTVKWTRVLVSSPTPRS